MINKTKVMKHFFYSWATFCFFALFVFSSCVNEDDVSPQGEITLNGQKLNIIINEETYQAEKPASRASQSIKNEVHPTFRVIRQSCSA